MGIAQVQNQKQEMKMLGCKQLVKGYDGVSTGIDAYECMLKERARWTDMVSVKCS